MSLQSKQFGMNLVFSALARHLEYLDGSSVSNYCPPRLETSRLKDAYCETAAS